MPTGHQQDSSLWPEAKTITSPFLLEAWILPVGKVGRGEEEAGPREQPGCCGQGAGPESPSIFSGAWPAQAAAAGPLAPGPRSVDSGIFLVALGMGGPPHQSQSPNSVSTMENAEHVETFLFPLEHSPLGGRLRCAGLGSSPRSSTHCLCSLRPARPLDFLTHTTGITHVLTGPL